MVSCLAANAGVLPASKSPARVQPHGQSVPPTEGFARSDRGARSGMERGNAVKGNVVSNGITEYLGVKNTPAYVKVYDKAAELHLDTDKVQLTRIEMTCDGEWTAEQLEEHWPQVHAWHSESGTKDYIRVIGIMLAEKAERNEDVETLINMLGRTSRPKVREYLRTPCVKLPDGAAALLLAEAKSWCGAVGGSM